jgi:hypothetical protein
MHIQMKTRNGVSDQQAQAKFASGIGGVMKRDVKVGVTGQQLEDAIALAPNGSIKEGM